MQGSTNHGQAQYFAVRIIAALTRQLQSKLWLTTGKKKKIHLTCRRQHLGAMQTLCVFRECCTPQHGYSIWIEHCHWKRFTTTSVSKILLILHFEYVINYLIVHLWSKSSSWIAKYFQPLEYPKSLDMAFQEPGTKGKPLWQETNLSALYTVAYKS